MHCLPKTHAPTETAHARDIPFGARARRTSRLRRARAFVASRPRCTWLSRIVLFVAALMALLLLLLSAGLIRHVYFDRSGLPDIEPFIRFQPPTTGKVYDARGKVLIELAR